MKYETCMIISNEFVKEVQGYKIFKEERENHHPYDHSISWGKETLYCIYEEDEGEDWIISILGSLEEAEHECKERRLHEDDYQW